MRRYGIALGALALMTAPTTAQEEPEQKVPGAALHAFRFRWPLPSEALVTEVTESSPGSTKKQLRYRLWFEPAAKEEGGMLLRIGEIEILPNESEARAEPVAGAPDPAWMEKLRPNLRIWEGGKCLGAVGFDKAAARYLAGVEKAERGFQREFLERNPVIRQTVEAEMVGFWVDWTSRWNGLTLAEGGNGQLEITETFPDGIKLPMSGVVVNYGVPEDQRQHIRVGYEAVLEGRAAVERAFDQAIAAAGETDGVAPKKPAIPDEVRRRVRVRATLERTTLRPVTVRVEVSGRGKLTATGKPEFALRREWAFQWTDIEPALPHK